MEGKVKASKNKNLLNKDNFSINKPYKKKIIALKQDFIKILKRYMSNYNLISVNYVGNPKSFKGKSNRKNFLIEFERRSFLLKQIDKKHIDKIQLKN